MDKEGSSNAQRVSPNNGAVKEADFIPSTKRDELVKNIEAELTCAVCSDRLNDPKVLPCLHTFCRRCVEGLVLEQSSEDDSRKVLCSLCREEHVLPAKGGVSELPTSPTFSVLVRLLEVLKAEPPGHKEALTCESGRDSNPAVVRCLDCEGYLCDPCLELHKMQVSSRNHANVTLKEIKESGGKCLFREKYCPAHKKELNKYCFTCSELMCEECITTHHSHETESISNIRVELNKFLDSTKHLVRESKESKDTLEKSMEKHKANVTAIHGKVDTTIEGLIELLKKRQVEIHNEIDTHAKEEGEKISADVENSRLTLERLTNGMSFVDRLLQSAGDSGLAAVAQQTLEQCNKLEAIEIDKELPKVSDWVFDAADKGRDDVAGLKVKVKLPMREVETQKDYFFKVLLIGEAEVGKSSLLARFINDTFADRYASTIGVEFATRTVQLDGDNVKLQIWDTAGVERFRSITTAYFTGARAIIFVYDVTNEDSFTKIKTVWLEQMKKYAKEDVCKMLVGSKCDQTNKRVVDFLTAKEFADELQWPLFEVSAKDGRNVEQAFLSFAAQTRSALLAERSHILL